MSDGHEVGSAEYWHERFSWCLAMLQETQERNAKLEADLARRDAPLMRYDDWAKAFPAALELYKYAMYEGNRVDFADAVRANPKAAKEALRRIHDCNLDYMTAMAELLAEDDYSELRHHLGHIEQGARAAYAIAGLLQRAKQPQKGSK